MRDTLFVEVLRLILVLLGALSGFEIGHSIDTSPAPAVGSVLGALVAYVIGGLIARLVDREGGRVVDRFYRIPPGELFAGTLTGIAGLLLGAALCAPLLALVHSDVTYPVAAAVVWVFTGLAFRVGVTKGRQVVAAAGLSRVLAPPIEPPPGQALLVDTSAAMDRSVLVLGRYGLLVGGLVVPRFVIDQLQTLSAGPDPVTSRRARRGLESLEAIRTWDVPVHVAENELPEIDDPDERLVEMARRLGLRIVTCSSAIKEAAKRRRVAVTDLRHLADDLTPDHPSGEQLVIDLVKEGNQPRQALGYLSDGDMVVVNDAAHMIGREDVVVEVLSTRRTSQGLLVFARLAQRPSNAGPLSAEVSPRPPAAEALPARRRTSDDPAPDEAPDVAPARQPTAP